MINWQSLLWRLPSTIAKSVKKSSHRNSGVLFHSAEVNKAYKLSSFAYVGFIRIKSSDIYSLEEFPSSSLSNIEQTIIELLGE